MRISKIEAKGQSALPPMPVCPTGKDAMLHSLSSQVSYYSKLIQGHEGWQYVGVYADDNASITKF